MAPQRRGSTRAVLVLDLIRRYQDAGLPGPSNRDLVDAGAISRIGNAPRMLDRLERHGLITRRFVGRVRYLRERGSRRGGPFDDTARTVDPVPWHNPTGTLAALCAEEPETQEDRHDADR